MPPKKDCYKPEKSYKLKQYAQIKKPNAIPPIKVKPNPPRPIDKSVNPPTKNVSKFLTDTLVAIQDTKVGEAKKVANIRERIELLDRMARETTNVKARAKIVELRDTLQSLVDRIIGVSGEEEEVEPIAVEEEEEVEPVVEPPVVEPVVPEVPVVKPKIPPPIPPKPKIPVAPTSTPKIPPPIPPKPKLPAVAPTTPKLPGTLTVENLRKLYESMGLKYGEEKPEYEEEEEEGAEWIEESEEEYELPTYLEDKLSTKGFDDSTKKLTMAVLGRDIPLLLAEKGKTEASRKKTYKKLTFKDLTDSLMNIDSSYKPELEEVVEAEEDKETEIRKLQDESKNWEDFMNYIGERFANGQLSRKEYLEDVKQYEENMERIEARLRELEVIDVEDIPSYKSPPPKSPPPSYKSPTPKLKPVEKPDFDKMTIKQLKEYAKEKGIRGYSKYTRKADLIEYITKGWEEFVAKPRPTEEFEMSSKGEYKPKAPMAIDESKLTPKQREKLRKQLDEEAEKVMKMQQEEMASREKEEPDSGYFSKEKTPKKNPIKFPDNPIAIDVFDLKLKGKKKASGKEKLDSNAIQEFPKLTNKVLNVMGITSVLTEVKDDEWIKLPSMDFAQFINKQKNMENIFFQPFVITDYVGSRSRKDSPDSTEISRLKIYNRFVKAFQDDDKEVQLQALVILNIMLGYMEKMPDPATNSEKSFVFVNS